VTTTDDLATARQALASSAGSWAVVVDDTGALRGWVGELDLIGHGQVADRAHRMDAWVPAGASLKQAFSEMLQHDAGWVAVLDGERYLGVLTPDLLHAALRRSVERSTGSELEASPLRA
jgi:osmoprotectant transport system ATP-binding protein